MIPKCYKIVILLFSATPAIFIWTNFDTALCNPSRALRPKSSPPFLCPKIHGWSGESGRHRAISSGRKGHYGLEFQEVCLQSNSAEGGQTNKIVQTLVQSILLRE
jgi:hypothetical protein